MNANFTKLDTILKSGAGITADKLSTARTINGTSFDGTANITTANWGAARNITITDGINTGAAVSVNGSGNVSLKLPTIINSITLQYSGVGTLSPLAASSVTVNTQAASQTSANQYLYLGHNVYEGQLTGQIWVDPATVYESMSYKYKVNGTYYALNASFVRNDHLTTINSYIAANSDIYVYCDINYSYSYRAATLTLAKKIYNWCVV